MVTQCTSALLLAPALLMLVAARYVDAQSLSGDPGLDARVQRILDRNQGRWHGDNVPPSDGRLLYDLIIKKRYMRVLEIGTSNGYSTTWMAWALSKTGGKLVTVEIDENRHQQAVATFREGGLQPFIDARLGDAHEVVPTLAGPFDLVFCDADKDRYTEYFRAVSEKIVVGGCFAAHNVRESRRPLGSSWEMQGAQAFLRFVLAQPGFVTTFDESGNGMALCFKKPPL
jgi:caffeoyl-CoA O-methyltransferase